VKSSDNHIDSFSYKQKYDFENPSGYFEHKVFGNDLIFYHFEGLDQLSSIIKKLIPLEKMNNIFSKKEEIFIKSGTFVDVAYTVPMLSGFPLILSGFGAYSFDLNYFGSVNKNFWETKSLDLEGKFRPSTTMELSTTMQIDLFHATTDVKIKSNVYSNYAIEVEAKAENSSFASFKMKLPQDRNDILSIRSQLIANIEGNSIFFKFTCYFLIFKLSNLQIIQTYARQINQL
jgi:hypothetical protein